MPSSSVHENSQDVPMLDDLDGAMDDSTGVFGDPMDDGHDSGVDFGYEDFNYEGREYSNSSRSDSPAPGGDNLHTGNDSSPHSRSFSLDAGEAFEQSRGSGSDSPELHAPPHAGRYAARVEDVEDAEQDWVQDEDGGDDPDAIDVPVGDPLYARAEELFTREATAAPSDELPPAFSEDPIIRHAYVRAFTAAAFQGATHELVHEMLNSDFKHFTFLSERHGFEIPGLQNMARTLRTVERRLGLDPDEHITYYFHCPVCWCRHHPRDLYKLEHNECTQEDCSGRLFKTKTLSDGHESRVPLKILPTVSLRHALQWILLRPGKLAELGGWREEDDAPGSVPPLSQEDWPGTHDSAFRMFDMPDGWGWRAVRAGLERRRSGGGKWSMEDVDVKERNQRFVALPIGLVLQFNMDW